VHRHGGRLLLTDLGSTNGTFLNGLRVYEVELPLSARFRVGPFEVTVSPVRGGVAPSAPGGSEFEGIVSVDPAMRALFAQIEKVAGSSAPVAIFGETGSGKELVARAVHRRSTRAGGAWVPLNCAAIAKELMESELFGHEKGAFTGAIGARSGALTEADGGTLFLDELGELPLELQAKLLRAVDLGEVKKVGAARPISVDVRFVCATHRSLIDEVRKGRFREDLYYRVAVATLFVPPLRQRKADIPLLWDHFMARLAPPGTRLRLGDEARQLLAGHSWPGNVRELRNVVQRALLASSGTEIAASDIQFDQRGVSVASAGADVIDPRGLTLEQIERAGLEIVMRQVKGNRRAASRQLDIAKSTLLKKLSDYQLEGVGSEDGEDED
jgi:DNA-binding NtrC family response regulator